MEPTLIAAILCPSFAVAAILAAVIDIRARRQTVDEQRFGSLRADLLKMREDFSLLRRALSRGACREIGAHVGARTCAIQQGGISKDMLVELLSDMSRRGYVLTAVELGLRDSKAAESIKQANDRLIRSIAAVGRSAPLIAEIFSLQVAFIGDLIDFFLSPAFYDRFLLDSTVFTSKVGKRLGSLRHARLHHRELAEIVGETAHDAVEGLMARGFSEVEQLTLVTVRTLTSKSDEELGRFVARAGRQYRKAAENGVGADFIDKLNRAVDLMGRLTRQFHPADRGFVQQACSALRALENVSAGAKCDSAEIWEDILRRDTEQTRHISIRAASINDPTGPRAGTGVDGAAGKNGKSLAEQIEEEDREGSVDVLVEDDE
ncbi:MAG: hypothetical protein GF344_03980 [Chitinivibrionales bacterium]|nr:hypothetical protein [Chitinivibrionales bacterium]MBD3356212.1 hypothetical protein [Chitinivibrionales bacterium]